MNNQLTRILGFILLVISAVFHKQIGFSVILLVLAGLVMLIKDRVIAARELSLFLKSFRLIGKRYVLIAFYDMVCLGFFFFAVPLLARWFTQRIGSVTSMAGIVSVIVVLAAYFAAVTLVLLVAYTIFKGLVWLTILNKNPAALYFKRFFLLNLCWWLILLVPFAVLLFGVKPDYLLYSIAVFAVLYIHVTSVMHFVFTRNLRLGNALRQGFVLAFGRFRDFLLPYSFMVLVYFVLLQVFWFIPKNASIMLFASLLFTVFYLAWYRIYLSLVLRKIT